MNSIMFAAAHRSSRIRFAAVALTDVRLRMHRHYGDNGIVKGRNQNPTRSHTKLLTLPKGTIIHSDRGSQYCATRYQQLIKRNGLRCSMGRRATCYDNAAMESFFHTLKVELVHRERYASRRSATAKIFEYIEVYYNRQRKHSAIGHQIPMLFEQKRP